MSAAERGERVGPLVSWSSLVRSLEAFEPPVIDRERKTDHVFLDEFAQPCAVDQVDGGRRLTSRLARRLTEPSERDDHSPLRALRRGIALEEGDLVARHNGRRIPSLGLHGDGCRQNGTEWCCADAIDSFIARATCTCELHAIRAEHVQAELFKGFRAESVKPGQGPLVQRWL